jgi:hypothetical protein
VFIFSGMLILMSSGGAPQQLSDKIYEHNIRTECSKTHMDGICSCDSPSTKPSKLAPVIVDNLWKVKARLQHFPTLLHIKGGGNSDSRRKQKSFQKNPKSRRPEARAGGSISSDSQSSAGERTRRKHPSRATQKDEPMISEPDASEREWTDMCQEGESDDGTIDLGGESISDVDMDSNSEDRDSSSSKLSASSRTRRRPSASDTQWCALIVPFAVASPCALLLSEKRPSAAPSRHSARAQLSPRRHHAA